MQKNELVVVTATASSDRLGRFIAEMGRYQVPVVAVIQRDTLPVYLRHGLLDAHLDYLGVVPAFARGCELALRAYPEAKVVACLHDDVEDLPYDWSDQVVAHFAAYPACGLLGFGGARQLGEDDIQTAPYSPYKLVRKDFISNMRDAEAHGRRVTTPQRIAVLDGFSMIFRRELMVPTLAWLQQSGIMHHCYDAACGCLAAREGWEVHLLPLACHHLGGQTAVGDARYIEWARTVAADGDQTFWNEAHKIVYAAFKHLLPIRV